MVLYVLLRKAPEPMPVQVRDAALCYAAPRTSARSDSASSPPARDRRRSVITVLREVRHLRAPLVAQERGTLDEELAVHELGR